MSLRKIDTQKFETLRSAFRADAVCLMECREKDTQEVVPIICIVVQLDDGDYAITPFAKLYGADSPFELLDPPDPGNAEGFLA